MKKRIYLAGTALLLGLAAGAGAQPGGGMLRMMDTDGDGRVSEAEFKPPRRGPGSERLQQADSNDDGMVSREEHAAMMAERQQQMQARAEAMFAAADADGDGALSQEEMQRAAFQRLDADGDGYITQEEFDRRRDDMPGGHRGKGKRGG
jgi:Ca2+-binding EF-hand superfamily protein